MRGMQDTGNSLGMVNRIDFIGRLHAGGDGIRDGDQVVGMGLEGVCVEEKV